MGSPGNLEVSIGVPADVRLDGRFSSGGRVGECPRRVLPAVVSCVVLVACGASQRNDATQTTPSARATVPETMPQHSTEAPISPSPIVETTVTSKAQPHYRPLVLTADDRVLDLAEADGVDLCHSDARCRGLRNPMIAARRDGSVLVGPSCELRSDCFLVLSAEPPGEVTYGKVRPAATGLWEGESLYAQSGDVVLAFGQLDGSVPVFAAQIFAHDLPMPVTDAAFVPGTNHLVVLAQPVDGPTQLWLLDLESLGAAALPGTAIRIDGSTNDPPGTKLLNSSPEGVRWSIVAASPDHATVIETDASGQSSSVDTDLENGSIAAPAKLGLNVVDADYSADGKVFVFVDGAGIAWIVDHDGQRVLTTDVLRASV